MLLFLHYPLHAVDAHDVLLSPEETFESPLYFHYIAVNTLGCPQQSSSLLLPLDQEIQQLPLHPFLPTPPPLNHPLSDEFLQLQREHS